MSMALRAVGLGLASGGRSIAGLKAVATAATPLVDSPVTGPAGAGAQALGDRVVNALSGPAGKRTVQLMQLGEVVADKLPFTPSRLAPPVLGVRAATGALSSYTLARRRTVAPAVPALIGATAALAGSVLGARWRALATERGWPDMVAALVEDLVVLGLATAAVRPAFPWSARG